MIGVLQKLNTEQRRAVDSIYGAVNVVAGPGTGKTQILAARIANMLTSDLQITPNMILALTYTNAGVVAMRKRLLSIIGPTVYQLNIHTFHSFCNEIIQANPDYFKIKDFEPVSELERLEIAYQIIEEMDNEKLLKRFRGDIHYDSRRLLNLWATMKEEGWTIDFYIEKVEEYISNLEYWEAQGKILVQGYGESGNDNKFHKAIVKQYFEEHPEAKEWLYLRPNSKQGYLAGSPRVKVIEDKKHKAKILIEAGALLKTYNEKMIEARRYDFSDMIHWVLKAWENDSFFLLNFQERYQFVLLDEFQDTNGSQLQLIDKLMSYWDDPNIFVVGDDEQCLFEFSGARIQNILDYQEKYEAELIILKQNYRSLQPILDAAKKVIERNDDRLVNKVGMNKDYLAVRTKQMLPLVISEFPSLMAETVWIVGHIEILMGYMKPKEIAVLYRKHKQANDLIQQLEARGIPYNIRRSINVLDTVIVKQLLDLLSIVVHLNELDADYYDNLLFRILHFYFLDIPIDKIHKFYLSRMGGGRIRRPKEIIKVEDMFAKLVGEYHNKPLVNFINLLIDKTGLLSWVLKQEEAVQKLQYVNSFFDWVKAEAFKRTDLDGRMLLDMIEKMKDNGLFLNVQELHGEEEGITLSTVHGAKGLEWESVIMMGCTANEWEKSRSGPTHFSLPDTLTKSIGEDKLYSNRRLFFVAMTRAKSDLNITYSEKDKNNKILEPSQFVAESELKIVKPQTDVSQFLFKQFLDADNRFNLAREFALSRVEQLRMSVSALNKYIGCQVSFYYENILRIPFVANAYLIFGNAIHLVLERAYKRARDAQEGEITGLQSWSDDFNNYIEKNKGQLTDAEYKTRMFLGEKILKHLWNDYFPESNKITLSEYRIKVNIDGVPFVVIIDKVEFEGIFATIIDYKTGNAANAKKKLVGPTDKNPLGGDYWRQKVVYKIAFDYIANFKEWRYKGFRLDMIDTEEVIKLEQEVTMAEELEVKKQIIGAYQGIQNLEFSQGCEDPDCIWCNFNKENNIKIQF